MVNITTPFDKDLAERNGKVNTTYVAYGKAGAEGYARQAAQDANASSAAPAVAAQRAVTKGSSFYKNSEWDLVEGQYRVLEAEWTLAEARVKALEDARDRAQQLAGALGLSLGEPMVVSELAGGGIFQFGGIAAAREMGGGGGPPVAPGELTVTIQVDVMYAIERASR